MTFNADTGGSFFGNHHPAQDMLAELTNSDGAPLYQTRQLLLADTPTRGRLGQYHIIGHFQGGMSDVYLCLQDVDVPQPPLALKTIRAELISDPSSRRAFNRECVIWARASVVPGVMVFWGLEHIESRTFIVMQGVIPGPKGEINLRDVIVRERLSLEMVVFFAAVIADSLARAARVVPGLVHGDLKPSNILMMWGSIPCISDFGIARAAAHNLRGDALPGTPEYCSPLARDPRAELTVLDDVYSYGVILEELLTGRRPKPSQGKAREVLARSDAAGNVRSELLTLAHQCHTVVPSERPRDFKAILDILEAIADWPIPDQIELIPHPSVSPGRLRSIAAALLELREFKGVLEFISTIKHQDRSWELWLFRGIALLELGSSVRARASLRAAQKVREAQKDGVESRGRDLARISHLHAVTYKKNRPAKSGKILHRLVSERVDAGVTEDAIFSLGAVYVDIGRLREAERLYLDLVIRQEDAYIWNQLGMIYLRLDEGERAADAYRRAIQLMSSNPVFHCGLGQALLRVPGQARGALQSFQHAVDVGDSSRDTLTFGLTAAYVLNDLAAIMRWSIIAVHHFQHAAPEIGKLAHATAARIKRGTLPKVRRARRDRRWEKRHTSETG
jgi:serine/threonine protein kinase